MITLEQAKALKLGMVLHDETSKNSDGTCQRWRVNGQPQVWKTRPDEVRIPVKHGLYDYGQIYASELHLFHLEAECTTCS